MMRILRGIAVDLRRRLEAHRRGMAAKYTRSRRPVALVYQEPQPDRYQCRRLRRDSHITDAPPKSNTELSKAGA